ncbi:hypothetical protein PM082_001122 [Marasmius tenuissimus]|nr:hypothetical protein PM082_001122 [Marasmius tenuissimus]
MATVHRDLGCPILPPELCDAVIDHCKYNRSTLGACSLVSKTWLPRSRSLLFHAISLSKLNLHSLCPLLASPHCTIAPFIQSCTVFPRVSSDELEKLMSTMEHSVFRRLQQLTSIVTICIPPQWLAQNTSTSLVSTITSLSVVGLLWYEETESFSEKCRQILQFASAFTLLESLEIGYETPGRVVPYTPTTQDLSCFPKIALPRLRRLLLGDVPYNVLLPWFLIPGAGAVELPSLSFFSFYIGYETLNVDSELLQEFLDTVCSPTVEEISFWLVWESFPALKLDRFESLRSVDLHTRVDQDDYHTKIFDLVSTLPTLGRTPLSVTITGDPTVQLPKIDGVSWSVTRY